MSIINMFFYLVSQLVEVVNVLFAEMMTTNAANGYQRSVSGSVEIVILVEQSSRKQENGC